MNISFRASRDEAPAYWMYGILWVPLVEAHQTAGSYSVIEQWMRKDSGALVPRVHNFCDEWFYVMEGTIEFAMEGKPVPAKAGDSIWVARGAIHSFVVTSDAHVLNGYTPGGFEQVIKHLAVPAPRRELPPADLPPPDEPTLRLIFNNYWTCEAGAGWEQMTDDPRSPAK
jgi:mannose-6-phosphate isomerase-like protein (cupin superfamily)